MNVTLIRHTLTPEELVALGARLCYSKTDLLGLQQRVAKSDQEGFCRKVIGMGHESVLEHASFTFGIEGVSRVLLAQLTRHRLASYSVQSQRYVCYDNGIEYVIPPKIVDLGDDAVKEYVRQMETAERWYREWCAKLDKGGQEDARYVLPGATHTRLMVTMNVRELRRFFELRCCRRAQWEIRALADEMLRICKEVAPALFHDAGPGCVRGFCPEGEKCCGKPRKVELA